MCNVHYLRWRKHGDPLVIKQVPSPALDWISEHATHAGDECLTWPFATGADGYGRVHMPKTGKLTTASRLMCIQVHGTPPSRRHEAAHRCGKGSSGCVNPRHIYWATPTDNQREKVDHKTSNRGTRQWQSRLTDADVLRIRELSNSMTQKKIAEMYGIDPGHISAIINRKKWSWL